MGATLSTIRGYAKEIADLNNSSFVSDTAWTFYINNAQRNAFGILANLHEDYFMTDTTFNFVNDQQDYDLPDDFWKLRGVDLLPGGVAAQATTIYPFEWIHRNRLKEEEIFSPALFTTAYRYRLLASELRFEPVPTGSGNQIRLWYIQAPTDLSSDSDATIIPNLFTEYIAMRAAYQALRKQGVTEAAAVKQDLLDARADMVEAARARRADLAREVAVIENDYQVKELHSFRNY